ncbi:MULTISPECIES: twin-arginine translocase subunit TatC [unclassified Paenibacillus]|uniref:twin-arginine translocase subunit TatC n=1 Tax=unclassified Paenibacillus TaxID=185978 RepID=UPI002406C1B8|nr:MULTISPECIES: twin-arginine translocase subunit TatC [unclassified Paenibacillus]MDF9842352.1 sec-independent protein translocase protein TatC [Paenibacillus sp. PastF-2]MDF9848942.1 sec-independent protein translocase protein TatC [Paenibacillus sp. PastM-2]MDF9855512.1 sec-independent protein translocase protein TatC [Paenibacillus sp. PastF-1]MDH6480783.1 sec-independent protein translocase protein TatC [Paenibacillus sp. PastH-2]MDH6508206.1 sec-independent protein translocase protein T
MSLESEEMSVVDHLTELRRRIIYVLLVFTAGLIGGLFAARPVYLYLIDADQAQGFILHAFSFWDGIGMYMKIAMAVSLAVSLPFIVYQLWAFISPGLRPEERSAALRYVPYVSILFILGLLFAYYIVFPMALSFTITITRSMGLEETYGITEYFSFMFSLCIPLALLFELPLIVMFLTKLRVLNPLRLRRMRRYAYFALVFIAVVITPPDFISDFLVTIPLLILYEFSVFLSALVYRRQLAEDAAREARYVKQQGH